MTREQLERLTRAEALALALLAYEVGRSFAPTIARGKVMPSLQSGKN